MPLTHPRLSQVLRVLRPGAKPLIDFRVEDHGSGPFLVDGTMTNPPTQAEVDAVTNAQLDAYVLDKAKKAAIANLNGGQEKPLFKLLHTLINDLRAVKRKQNAVIAATAVAVPPFPAGQTTTPQDSLSVAQAEDLIRTILDA